ncbi:MAG: glucan 1,4-alpha-glucosidase [Anaerolineaceae bacterium]|nr:glucan 1,4-alpha-glucosidase [Anaerolineaceae bacterium]MCB9098262.1 glucan 1,4-alpha-glucosidase [Anaerolineales bacterium]
MNYKRLITVSLLLSLFSLIGPTHALATGGGGAFGVPGAPSTWSYAGKQGIGTAYEQYQNKLYSDTGPSGPISKVWFSLAQGIVTETAFGQIHEAQIKDLQFLVTGDGFFDEEKVDTTNQIEYLYTDSAGRPLSLAYRVINTDPDGKYQIEKHIFTDPDRQSLFMHVIFTANEANITPYILVNPHMNNTGSGDVGFVSDNSLSAREGEGVYMTLKSSQPFIKTSAGFVGQSDGYTDLNDNGVMDWTFDWADDGGGNVALTAQLPTLNSESVTFDVVVGFGDSLAAATTEADGTLTDGYATILDRYNGIGGNIGWEDYLAGLSNLPAMIPQTGDDGKLLYASAMVLKSLEDKENAGALIASLSIPWGDTVSADASATGYRAVWPRDFYQVAMALLALGDTQTPIVSFEYLDHVQVDANTPNNSGATGWFLQKTPVNGTLEWYRVQLDQTAMPIMLGWKLWQAGLLSNGEITTWYNTMLKPAAEFLANGGQVHLLDNNDTITPPRTQQERWEEQFGYSPSTTAALITGLLAAADIAENAAADPGAAAWYKTKADEFESTIETYMFTTTGTHVTGDDNGQYFLRITQNEDPNDGANINGSNGKSAINEKEVLDAGFLELVRYGVRRADNPAILDSLVELDDETLPDNLRLKYDFTFPGDSTAYPGWRRYGNDGYGERTDDGSNYVGSAGDQRGRVWPFFTGERGHFELELAKANAGGALDAAGVAALRDVYVRALENYANEGLMLPEQVWDGVGSNTAHNYTTGEATNSATPLAWTHAEYVKLVKSLTDQNTWDSYAIVRDRYGETGGLASTYPQIYFRGTPNTWSTTPMTLTADYTWVITPTFGSAGNERFKFDVNGDWSLNFGDNQPDGIADQAGADIPITEGPGDYTITFNDQTKAYTVTKQGGGGFASMYPQVYFRGTPNTWTMTPMTLTADNVWSIDVTFGSAASERFKFDISGDWTLNFGDNEPDGIADQTGNDIVITAGAGNYTITFNDQSKVYTVVKN